MKYFCLSEGLSEIHPCTFPPVLAEMKRMQKFNIYVCINYALGEEIHGSESGRHPLVTRSRKCLQHVLCIHQYESENENGGFHSSSFSPLHECGIGASGGVKDGSGIETSGFYGIMECSAEDRNPEFRGPSKDSLSITSSQLQPLPLPLLSRSRIMYPSMEATRDDSPCILDGQTKTAR